MRLSFYSASHLHAFVRQLYGVDAERVGEALTTDPGIPSWPYLHTYSSVLPCLLETRT